MGSYEKASTVLRHNASTEIRHSSLRGWWTCFNGRSLGSQHPGKIPWPEIPTWKLFKRTGPSRDHDPGRYPCLGRRCMPWKAGRAHDGRNNLSNCRHLRPERLPGQKGRRLSKEYPQKTPDTSIQNSIKIKVRFIVSCGLCHHNAGCPTVQHGPLTRETMSPEKSILL